MTVQPIVLDTNIVLDAFVFRDASTAALRAKLDDGRLRWIATDAMRDELARVLGYPKIAPRLAHGDGTAAQVLGRFDAQACRVASAARAALACRDADDQKFIDLAVAHGALLLSKDRAVLALARRLARLGIWAGRTLP